MDWLATAAGLAILLVAGDALVKGAVNLSLRLGIPALIVSLTVVAFGTSAPEMLVAISAVLDHAPGIAIGNIVGSNTANILLVLGLPALISGLNTSHFDTRESYVFMLIGSALFIGAAFLGPITWVHGLVLLAALTFVLADAISDARAHRRDRAPHAETVASANPMMSGRRITLLLLAGFVGLPLGAQLLVDGAVSIARTYGIRESVIGLTLISVGTSLPELATTAVAAIRRNAGRRAWQCHRLEHVQHARHSRHRRPFWPRSLSTDRYSASICGSCWGHRCCFCPSFSGGLTYRASGGQFLWSPMRSTLSPC